MLLFKTTHFFPQKVELQQNRFPLTRAATSSQHALSACMRAMPSPVNVCGSRLREVIVNDLGSSAHQRCHALCHALLKLEMFCRFQEIRKFSHISVPGFEPYGRSIDLANPKPWTTTQICLKWVEAGLQEVFSLGYLGWQLSTRIKTWIAETQTAPSPKAPKLRVAFLLEGPRIWLPNPDDTI